MRKHVSNLVKTFLSNARLLFTLRNQRLALKWLIAFACVFTLSILISSSGSFDSDKYSSEKFNGAGSKHIFESYNDSLLRRWRNYTKVFCSGNYHAIGHQFAMLRNVVVDRRFLVSPTIELSSGNSPQLTVTENFSKKGAYQVLCRNSANLYYDFQGEKYNWLTNTMSSVEYCNPKAGDCDRSNDEARNITLVVVQRYNSDNLWHAMCDWYNAFLTLAYFHVHPNASQVLLLDAQPHSTVDSVWSVLFPEQLYVQDLPERTLYRQVIFSIHHNHSFLNSYLQWKSLRLPAAEQFSRYVLAQHDVSDVSHSLSCYNLSVTVLLRRDYSSNATHGSRRVGRKVENEEELLASINKFLTQSNEIDGLARKVYFEELPMREQLLIISRTDVLIGMHGAGLAHAMFLPRHAGLIELRQLGTTDRKYEGIAAGRRMAYADLVVDRMGHEVLSHLTVVPPASLPQLFITVLTKMGCML